MSFPGFKFVVLAFLLAPVTAFADEAPTPRTLTINTPVLPPYTTENRDGLEDLLMREIFSRLGIAIKIVHVPSERGMQDLNSGRHDGVLSRIMGLQDIYPNIVPFEERASVFSFVAFSRRSDIRISEWNDLGGHRVALINGWKILETNAQGREIVKVRGAEQLFRLLDADRVDVALYARLPGIWLAAQLGYDDIRAHHPPLARRDKFFYLHERHRNLIGSASEALREMKRDGTYDLIYEQSVE